LIREAFKLFHANGISGYEDEEHGVLKMTNVRNTLEALEITDVNMGELRLILDPTHTNWVTYPDFLSYAARRMLEASSHGSEDDEAHMKEVQSAFGLFTHSGPGPIHIAHLRRVARTLKEDVTDEELKNMIVQANGRKGKGSWESGVTMGEFERVLGEAGVWKSG